MSTSSSDPSTGFLLQKLITTSLPEFALTISENTTNPASYQAQISPSIDWYALTEKILLTIINSDTLRTIFCNIDCEVLPTCMAPSNFSVAWSNPNFQIGYGAPSGITGVNVYYREKGTTPWLDTSVTPTNPQPPTSASTGTIVVTGLDLLTIYEFRVASICPDTSESFSITTEAFSVAPLSVTTTPFNSKIDFDFGTLDFVDKIYVTLKDTLGNPIGTQIMTNPTFTTSFLGLTPATSYNPEYYYSYTVNGVPTNSPVYTMATVSTL